MKEIYAALLKAQKEMGNAKKDSTNPFFHSTYADINSVREAVIPLLNENGIIVIQPMISVDGNEYIKTILCHESGEVIESFTKILCKAQNDPQAYGSGVTYARRYGLQSLLCIGAEDDDANNAMKESTKKTEAKKEVPGFLDVNKAIDEMDNAKDRIDMNIIWGKYVGLQKDPNFIESAKKAGIKYPKTEKNV
jgi:hypothetical protein